MFSNFIPDMVIYILQKCNSSFHTDLSILFYDLLLMKEFMEAKQYVFGFVDMKPQHVKFKNKYFKFIEMFFEHTKLSIQFGVTKRSIILRKYLHGVCQYLFSLQYPFKKTKKYLKRITKLIKQVYQQLQNHDLLKSLSKYRIDNISPLSLFSLTRHQCGTEATWLVTPKKKKRSVAC